MRTERFHAQGTGEGSGFARVKGDDAVLKLVEVTSLIVVLHRDDRSGQTLADVGDSRGDRDFAVIQYAVRGNGDIRPRQLLLFRGDQGFVCQNRILTGSGRTVVLDTHHT